MIHETKSRGCKSDTFVHAINDALQSLVAVCRSIGVICDHDCFVDLMEGMHDLERGMLGLLESLQMQMPNPNELAASLDSSSLKSRSSR